jgi:hypothetical protein
MSSPAISALDSAIERRVLEVMNDLEDDINLDPRVLKARAELKTARLSPGPTRILDVVAADGSVRQAIREIIAERLLEVTR